MGIFFRCHVSFQGCENIQPKFEVTRSELAVYPKMSGFIAGQSVTARSRVKIFQSTDVMYFVRFCQCTLCHVAVVLLIDVAGCLVCSSCAMSREQDLDEPRNKRARLSDEGIRWRNKTNTKPLVQNLLLRAKHLLWGASFCAAQGFAWLPSLR